MFIKISIYRTYYLNCVINFVICVNQYFILIFKVCRHNFYNIIHKIKKFELFIKRFNLFKMIEIIIFLILLYLNFFKFLSVILYYVMISKIELYIFYYYNKLEN